MSLRARLERLDGRRPLSWEIWRQVDDDVYTGPNGKELSTAGLERRMKSAPSSIGFILVNRSAEKAERTE